MILKKTSILIAKCCAIIVFFLGLLFSVSLIVHQTALVQLDPGYTPIKFNTALGFLLAGLGLFGLAKSNFKLVILSGSIIAFVSSLTLLEYALDYDFGIDQFFITQYISFQSIHPGRMAPITALGLLIASLILFSSMFKKVKWFCILIRLFSACIFVVGVVPLAGYMTGVAMAYRFGQFAAMSPQASVIFILMGLGFSAFFWQDELPRNRSILAIWLPALLSMIVLIFLDAKLNCPTFC